MGRSWVFLYLLFFLPFDCVGANAIILFFLSLGPLPCDDIVSVVIGCLLPLPIEAAVGSEGKPYGFCGDLRMIEKEKDVFIEYQGHLGPSQPNVENQPRCSKHLPKRIPTHRGPLTKGMLPSLLVYVQLGLD